MHVIARYNMIILWVVGSELDCSVHFLEYCMGIHTPSIVKFEQLLIVQFVHWRAKEWCSTALEVLNFLCCGFNYMWLINLIKLLCCLPQHCPSTFAGDVTVLGLRNVHTKWILVCKSKYPRHPTNIKAPISAASFSIEVPIVPILWHTNNYIYHEPAVSSSRKMIVGIGIIWSRAYIPPSIF